MTEQGPRAARSVIHWPSTMGKIEMTQPIAAPPPHVFAFFMPQRMPYWYGREMESSFEVLDAVLEKHFHDKAKLGCLDVRAPSVGIST